MTMLKILAKLWGIALMVLAVFSGYKLVEYLFMTEHPSGLSTFMIIICAVLALVDLTVFYGGFLLLTKKLKK